MPQVANTFATFNSTRNREQLMNNIWNVSVSDTPFVKLIGKEKVDGVFVEWNTDSYAAGAANKVEQGNQSAVVAVTPTVRLNNRTQISEKVFGVTGTQEVVEKAGGKSERSYQLAKKMVELAGQTRFDKAEDKTLTATLEVYIGPFGRVKAVNARHMRQREVAIINPEYLALGMLRAMKDTDLAKIGDTQNVLVNTEWTLINKNTRAHGAVLDLTTV